jgi:hypothetical protein
LETQGTHTKGIPEKSFSDSGHSGYVTATVTTTSTNPSLCQRNLDCIGFVASLGNCRPIAFHLYLYKETQYILIFTDSHHLISN